MPGLGQVRKPTPNSSIETKNDFCMSLRARRGEAISTLVQARQITRENQLLLEQEGSQARQLRLILGAPRLTETLEREAWHPRGIQNV